MLDNARWDSVDEVVSSTDFYRPQHQLIFDAMRGLAEDNQPLDVVTVSTRLQHNGQLEKAGSAIYIAEMGAFYAAAVIGCGQSNRRVCV